MYGLSLCSGIGGLDLGLHLAIPGYSTVCYVEIEAYPQDILFARMADGILERAPIWSDLKSFDARVWNGLVDVVHGGYPCQPFSVAGNRAGSADPRHLWPDVARIVRECEPEWCFFENVAGHLTLGFEQVAQDLEEMGYRVTAGLFTAAEVGAPQRRQRLFILARHARFVADTGRSSDERRDDTRGVGGVRSERESTKTQRKRSRVDVSGGRDDVGRADNPRLEGWGETEQEGADERAAWPPGPEERDRWAGVDPRLYPAVADTEAPAQPTVRGVAHGFPRRVDRLKALGNAVVPDVVALAWRTLVKELEAK